MFDQDYFALRLVRLKSPEEWASQKEGLCFVFPKGGVGQYLGGSAAQRLAPGDVLVWEGGPEGRVSVPKGAEMVFWSFSLRLEHLFPLFDGDEISLLQEIAGNFKGSKLFPASMALAVKCHRWIEEVPAQPDLEHRSHLLRVAAAILNEEFMAMHHQRVGLGQVEERIIRVFDELSVDQLLELSVGELAARFGCSRRHLNRLFHHYFGFSVGALRMEMRLLKAVSLLRDVDAKVINVAAQCGFNHLGLFNTCFKKRFGVSPGHWRKQAARGKIRPATAPGDDSTCPLQGKGLCPLAACAPGGNTSPAPKASPAGKSSDAKISPALHAGEQAIEPHLVLTYPKASNTTPLTA
jgi:AraC family of transcriptional regulator, multidrug resistance transcriptional activator